MKRTTWTLWIALLLCGVCLPLGFIVAIIATGEINTLGGIICIIGLSWMGYDCGKSAYRQLPWKIKL
jgi:hypothetical protein